MIRIAGDDIIIRIISWAEEPPLTVGTVIPIPIAENGSQRRITAQERGYS